ncbi:MAG: hypothetical protein M1840_002242 [Geoglossum simile]|nr:MAG: hypothetical protein M1840_002242 [Geoglossum simile]
MNGLLHDKNGLKFLSSPTTTSHYDQKYTRNMPRRFVSTHSSNGSLLTDSLQVIRPEILTIAHGSTHVHAPSAMSEVVDNNSIQIDPFELTEQVSDAAARSSSKGAMGAKKEMSELKYLWNGILDDIFGPTRKP